MNAQDHCSLAVRLRAQDRIDEALAHIEQAIALVPSDPILRVNLGILLRDLGRLDEAVAAYGEAIALRPQQADAHFLRAEIKRFRLGDPELAAMDALVGRPDLPPRDTIHLHFALGKARDDIGDHARAFAHWRQGNALKRAQVAYDEKPLLAGLRQSAAGFDRAAFERLKGYGHPSAQLIFVVGMPRSGSSLIEQILASHPQVHAAGELGHLAAVAGDRPEAA
ncbi:MAG TPA: tetratricopeptide repeat protein, partial [Opitutaceae bacterium]|nr:tetratricopeptide repeat protein [Opitutaceae bacterium]